MKRDMPNISEAYRFSKNEQSHKVVLDFVGNFMQYVHYKYTLMIWIVENTSSVWNMYFETASDGKVVITVSFSDLGDATLFRLRF